MTSAKTLIATLTAAGALFACPMASAFDFATDATPVVKTDNGLGDLPNVNEWREPFLYAHPAPKLDSGLGDAATAAESAALHPTPAAKVDSGLGALPRYERWTEPFVFTQPAPKVDTGFGALPRYSNRRS